MADEIKESAPATVSGQPCPMCNTNNLTLMEEEREVPYFGKCYLFSMNCSNCKYHKADIEASEEREPSKYTLEIDSEEDMKIRVVRGSHGSINLMRIAKIEGGPEANGFVTNVEGIINRIRRQIEVARDTDDDPAVKKRAKNLLKKLTKIAWGQEKCKLIIEDKTGNSAIISDKAVKSKA